LEGWQDVLPVEKIPVLAVTLMLNQRSFLGVSRDGVLLYKSDLDVPWKHAANSNADAVGGAVALRSVTMLLEGTPLGIRKDTGELLSKGSSMPFPDPDKLPESWPGILTSAAAY
jgi:hypothetical protein